jgi:hypothetical protein
MRIGADGCRQDSLGLCSHFGSAQGRPRASPDCHGKEGVDGSSPSEGFASGATARSSCFRSGTADPFRREEVNRCRRRALRGRLRPAECRVLSAEGTDAVHARCEHLCRDRPRWLASVGPRSTSTGSPNHSRSPAATVLAKQCAQVPVCGGYGTVYGAFNSKALLLAGAKRRRAPRRSGSSRATIAKKTR